MINTKNKKILPLGYNNSACAGCSQIIAARAVAEAAGPDVIVANATGCLEVTTSPCDQSAWNVPWIHSLFENAAAVASGISASLRKQGKNKTIKVIAQGGDGSTFDIGFGIISGMWERSEDIVYVCYDNESYANTGMQASGATPPGSRTTTTPVGREEKFGAHGHKKDMIAIALAHGLKYVAQTTAGFPDDIAKKLKQALNTEGPSYIQILVPCIPGWGISPGDSMNLARLAAETGLYPQLEYINGELTNIIKIGANKKNIIDYLKPQKRFNHLFVEDADPEMLKSIQNIADQNIKKYGL